MKTLLILCFAVAGFAGFANAETVVVEHGHRHHYVRHHYYTHHHVSHSRHVTVVHEN